MGSEKTKILILMANPSDSNRLNLGNEYQLIRDLLNVSPLERNFELELHTASQAEKLLQKVLKFKPNLIYFSGHGEEEGLVFTDLTGDNAYEVSKQALAELFRLCAPDLKTVFLNACYSANQADEIIDQVDYFIGMNADIDDLAAIKFAEGFYTALFFQDTLNIEQAFDAGLIQMATSHIPKAEQQKPTLQKRPHNYIPNYQHDVFISFADADTKWTNDLTDYLRKQLKQKLATSNGFKLYKGNNFSELEQSAILLIIASPAYCLQYQAQLEQLRTQIKQQPVFLVECEVCNPQPEILKGFTAYKFKLMPTKDADYFAKADELVSDLADHLNELKKQQECQQSLEQQRQQQQNARDANINSIDALVFLHSAPEDLDLTQKIAILLDSNGIDCMLPLPRLKETTADDISSDIANNIRNCDAVLILYEKTSPVWVREQLSNCRTLQRERKKPLKIIALHKGKEESLNCGLRSVHIYCCPPENTETYLPAFIEALR